MHRGFCQGQLYVHKGPHLREKNKNLLSYLKAPRNLLAIEPDLLTFAGISLIMPQHENFAVLQGT